MDSLTLATAFKMTIALGFVLLVFGAAIWIAKKFTVGKSSFFSRGNKPNVRPLEVLAFQALGPGKNIYIVRCYNQKILVGATAQHVNLLNIITEDQEVEDEIQFSEQLEEKNSDNVTQETKNRFGSFLRDLSRV